MSRVDLIFLRHTPVAAPPGLCYGRLDLDCSSDFADHAADTAAQLRGLLGESDNTGPGQACLFRPLPALVCHTSPLRRCTRLADYLNAELFAGSLDIRPDARLAEMDFGRFEGRLWDQISREESRAWMDDWLHQPCPGGESWPEVLARVSSFVASLRAGAPRESGLSGAARPAPGCLVLSHGGVWCCLRVILDGLDPQSAFAAPVPEPGGIWQFRL